MSYSTPTISHTGYKNYVHSLLIFISRHIKCNERSRAFKGIRHQMIQMQGKRNCQKLT